jgi:prepilin-type processing-associated H-X9-DG protein
MSWKDWEETGGKPQASPERGTGQAVATETPVEFGTGPQFFKQPWFDPISRRRLMELIGAFLIIGCVLYVFIPVFSGTTETGRRTVCANNLRRLVQSLRMYETDNDGLPPTGQWTYSLYQYVLDRKGLDALFCPSEANLPRLRRKRLSNTTSYTYVNPQDRRLIGDETTIPVFWDTMGGIGRAAHPGGGNIGYLDGHAAWLPADRWSGGDLP